MHHYPTHFSEQLRKLSAHVSRFLLNFAYKVLIRKPHTKRPLENKRYEWEKNNKMERAATENERFVNKVMKSIKENFLNSKAISYLHVKRLLV